MRLEGKIAIVTASTRGIGKACAELFAREGATVYLAARNQEQAHANIQAAGQLPGQLKFVYNDATKPETYQSMVDTVVGQEGRLDILVNTFGTSDPRLDLDIVKTKSEDFLRFVDINLQSVFLGTQAALIPMMAQRSGSIVNISSISGQVPDVSQIAYGCSKAAIDHMTKMIAVQAGAYNVRCNAVAPGITATDAVKNNLTPVFKDIFMKSIPMGRMATPEEIAKACLYFASDESAYTTGQILQVAGGFGLGTPIYGDLSQMMTQR